MAIINALRKPNIHDVIWLHTIYKLQHEHYKIAWSYVAYDLSYRIKLLSISYDMTKSYATKSRTCIAAFIMYIYYEI